MCSKSLYLKIIKQTIGREIYIYTLNIFKLIILLLFNYSCLHVPLTTPPTPAKPTSLLCFHPPPWFCPCVLYSSWEPFSPLSPPPSPLAITFFLISMTLKRCFFLLWVCLLSQCNTPMLIAALFTIATCWRQPKFPSVDEWNKKLWYLYTKEHYTAKRKKELFPSATPWMKLENIMLSEISQ